MDPASIRYKNPGAQYPGPTAKRWGSTGTGVIGGGHKIAGFPTFEAGGAAYFDLFARKYVGKPLSQAIHIWSGGNSSPAYVQHLVKSVPGLKPDTIITPEMIANPDFAIPFAKAQTKWETGRPYPMSDQQWATAHRMALGGPKAEGITDKGSYPSLAGGPNVAMNGAAPGVAPTGPAGGSPAMLTNAGRQSTDQTIDPTTMVGAPSGAMLTNYGRSSAPGQAPAPAPVSTPMQGPAPAPTPVGPSGPSWADMMQQQMMGGAPAIQGSLDVASKVNKSSPQYKNALIGMLGGIF